jgi:glycosyltransferase involved in cell wall biosynthesis
MSCDSSARVSIAMATYNGSRHIAEQLASFASQTRLPDELVVSDDGSSDDTVAIVERFAATAPFDVVIRRNPAAPGVSRNFQSALEGCSGDIIFLSDQDDMWFDQKIATVLEAFAQSDERTHYVINDQMITDGELNPSGRTKLQNIRSAGISESLFITGCCTAFTREWRDFCLPFPEVEVAHDVWIGSLANRLEARKVVSVPLQYYRRHGENVSDWEMSSGQGASRLSIARKYGLRDARAGWLQRASVLEAYHVRITERADSAIVRRVDLAAKLRAIDMAAADLKARSAFCSLPRLRRIVPVLRFLANGRYARSSGIASAAKDLLRR